MKQGVLAPETGSPKNNEHFEMIDAQLTTDIWIIRSRQTGYCLKIAHLPIQTTTREEAEYISKFYATMYALASITDSNKTMSQQIFWMADQARNVLPDGSYAAHMFEYTRKLHGSGIPWE